MAQRLLSSAHPPLREGLQPSLGKLVFALAFLLMTPAVTAEEPAAEGATAEAADAASADAADADAAGMAVPSAESLEEEGAVVGRVLVRVGDIFDTDNPEEDRRLFRLANRLHRKTRDRVIAEQLLFEEGDPFSAKVLAETERLLRSRRYLYDAQIRPVRYSDNRVDLLVETRDVWTLGVGVGVLRSGGVTSTQFEIQDPNFLGTGKDVSLKYDEDIDRTSTAVRYADPNLLGSRTELELFYSSNSDGGRRKLQVERPFFSLGSGWASGIVLQGHDKVDNLYRLGRISDSFQHEQRFMEVYGGLAAPGGVDRAYRWTAGYTFVEDQFAAVPGVPRLEVIPDDRAMAYPWVGFQWVEDQYIEAKRFNQIHRTEDLHLGRSFWAKLGYSDPTFDPGAETEVFEGAVFEGGFTSGFKPRENHFFTFNAYGVGRYGDDGTENMLLSGDLRYYWRNFRQHLLYVRLQASYADDLDHENQLMLGGDNGLRGYPLRYQEGDQSVLLTLEQRFFTNWHVLQLFHVGAAVFVDAGRAWYREENGFEDFGVLADAGVGLRLSASRSGRGRMIHLDLAFPFDGDSSIDSVQWLITTSETF